MKGRGNKPLVFVVLITILFASWFQTEAKKKPIIIDTDLDIDDVQAIIYLVKSENVEIRGITVCGNGFSDPIFGVPNLLYVLDQIGCPNIPVAYGANVFNTMLNPATPSANDGNPVPSFIRVGIDLYFSKCLNLSLPFDAQASSLPAEDLIIAILEDSNEPVDILLLGTATNVAKSFIQDPSVKKKVGTLYWSGGNFDTSVPLDGKTWPYASKTKGSSWNIFADPLAAERLFVSGLPMFMMTSNAQDHLIFDPSVLPGYQAKHNIDPFIIEVVAKFASCTGQDDSDIQYWDQSAAMWMEELQQGVEPTICTEWQNLTNAVVSLLNGGSFGRNFPSTKGGKDVKTCKVASLDRFLPKFFAVLGQPSLCPPPSNLSNPITADDVMDELVEAKKTIESLQAQQRNMQTMMTQMQQALSQLQRQCSGGSSGSGSGSGEGSGKDANVVNINFDGILRSK